MAKIKTTQNEDDLSVISEEIKRIAVIVENLGNQVSKMEQNKALYSDLLEKERVRSSESLKYVISQEIANLNGVSRDIVALEQKATESIQKTSSLALQEVKNRVFEKVKASKQMIWTLGIGGILVALATIAILVTRSFDKNTIVESLQEKAKYEYLMNDLKQWAKENPNDAKSFNQWLKNKAEK